MVTIARRGPSVAVTVFGNADAALVAAQEQVALALEAAPSPTSG